MSYGIQVGSRIWNDKLNYSVSKSYVTRRPYEPNNSNQSNVYCYFPENGTSTKNLLYHIDFSGSNAKSWGIRVDNEVVGMLFNNPKYYTKKGKVRFDCRNKVYGIKVKEGHILVGEYDNPISYLGNYQYELDTKNVDIDILELNLDNSSNYGISSNESLVTETSIEASTLSFSSSLNQLHGTEEFSESSVMHPNGYYLLFSSFLNISKEANDIMLEVRHIGVDVIFNKNGIFWSEENYYGARLGDNSGLGLMASYIKVI